MATALELGQEWLSFPGVPPVADHHSTHMYFPRPCLRYFEFVSPTRLADIKALPSGRLPKYVKHPHVR